MIILNVCGSWITKLFHYKERGFYCHSQVKSLLHGVWWWCLFYIRSPFAPCMSWHAQSGRRTSFGRWVGFIKLYILLAIFFLFIYLFIYSWYKRPAVVQLNNWNHIPVKYYSHFTCTCMFTEGKVEKIKFANKVEAIMSLSLDLILFCLCCRIAFWIIWKYAWQKQKKEKLEHSIYGTSTLFI
jgi:hypothetical protein